MEPVVRTEGLSKSYGTLDALKSLDLEIQRGEIFGYLGPNGAGKTTTIRLLMDFIRPTSGRVTVFGLDPRRDGLEIRRRIGNLPGEFGLWSELNGWQTLNYLGRLRGDIPKRRIGELAERLSLDLSRRVAEYSHGNKQKVGLIQALMSDPEFIILDEPTTGLDPVVQNSLHEILEERREAGCSVMFSSHILSEVERICDRVGILRAGELQTLRDVASLQSSSVRWMTIRCADPVDSGDFDTLPGVSDVTITDGRVRLKVSGEMDPVVKAAARLHVLDLDCQEPSLEETFFQYYGER